MLGACALALTALDAVGCLALAVGCTGIAALGAFNLVVDQLAVPAAEDVGNGDVHGAALGAVAAGGALDAVHLAQRIQDVLDDSLLGLVQGLEALHVAQVVLHLGDVGPCSTANSGCC